LSRDESFWQNGAKSNKDLRLMVKRVLITSDLGEDFLPKWANWVKVLVDGEIQGAVFFRSY
jgi:heat shock protein 90kDa beta